ncbi:unnamed protein product, partial [Didymodactylos carnosus]
ALNDSLKALELDDKNVQAYLRKGLSAYHLGKKDEALESFTSGLKIDPNQDQLKIWRTKCEEEITRRYAFL